MPELFGKPYGGDVATFVCRDCSVPIRLTMRPAKMGIEECWVYETDHQGHPVSGVGMAPSGRLYHERRLHESGAFVDMDWRVCGTVDLLPCTCSEPCPVHGERASDTLRRDMIGILLEPGEEQCDDVDALLLNQAKKAVERYDAMTASDHARARGCGVVLKWQDKPPELKPKEGWQRWLIKHDETSAVSTCWLASDEKGLLRSSSYSNKPDDKPDDMRGDYSYAEKFWSYAPYPPEWKQKRGQE